MAKINLSKIDMGLGQIPDADPLHDTRTLLNRSLGTDSEDYRAIPLEQICMNPLNDYSDGDTDADIIELANDIERNGLLHNIVVSAHKEDGGAYMILSGERRFRAYRWLRENRKENKYALILCKVLTGLDALDEMLVLDAANLQTRGGMGDEKRYRKATMRFLENLRKKGGISEEEAKTLAVRYTGVSDALLDKNLAVERDLHPDILSLLDRGLIPKNQAVAYAHLPKDIQELLAANLTAAYDSGAAALRDVNEKLTNATKTITDLRAKAETQEKHMHEVEEEISDAQLSLSALNAMAEAGEDSEELEQQRELVRKTLSALEMQKRMYVSTITSAKAALKKSEEKLTAIGAERKTGDVLTDDIAQMVNKSMKKAEAAVNGIVSRTTLNRIAKLDATGKQVMLERLTRLEQQLSAALAALDGEGKGTDI